jgi:hypothetical protein
MSDSQSLYPEVFRESPSLYQEVFRESPSLYQKDSVLVLCIADFISEGNQPNVQPDRFLLPHCVM